MASKCVIIRTEMVPKKRVAVHIQSEVQFFTLEPLLKELKKAPYSVEIVTDVFENNQNGYKEMAASVVQLIKKAGYNPKSLDSFKDIVFDVYLTPYIDGKVKAKCYLKYEYGTLNIKPNLTYIPAVMQEYHGFLCQSTITNDLLQVYGKTFPVDNLRFFGKKKKTIKREKPQVLFAPTYNDVDTEDELVEIVKNLKRKYYVVVKGHHGTEFLKKNASKKQVLVDLADKYYGSDASLSDLIMESDVCLFGNSSAIAEAIYAGVPCAVVTEDLDCFKLDDIHTTQYLFVRDGYIPYAKDAKDVTKAVDEALTKKFMEKQKELSKKIFPKEYHTGVQGYLDVIDYFLYDEVGQDYLKLHDRNIEEKMKMKKELEEANAKIEILEDTQKRKLNRLAAKIYKVEGRIRHGKS